MGKTKLLRTIRPHLNSKRNESIRQGPCGDSYSVPHMRIRSPFRGSLMAEHLDNFLDTKTMHINITDYAKQNRLSEKCPIHKIHASQLAANNPIEDRWNCGFIQTNDKVSKMVFSVIDGHSGYSCSHALAWIVLEYISATLLESDNLSAALKRLSNLPSNDELSRLIVEHPILYNHKGKNVTKRFMKNRLPSPELRKFLLERLITFMQELRCSPTFEKCFWEKALMRLDNELCSLGLDDMMISKIKENPFSPTSKSTLSPDLLRVAQSGAVGVFGLLDWSTASNNDGDTCVELQIASVGDCSAVLFSTSSDNSGELKPQRLGFPHNGSTNVGELSRLIVEHPEDKVEELIRNGGRLLGELAPTRAFGDVRYKWPSERLRQMAEYFGATANSGEKMISGTWAGLEALPSPYTSPPYLTAKPEVATCVLRPSDRYLVLATDGLWDTLSPEIAANLLSHLQPGQCPATRLMRAALSLPVGPESPSHRSVVKEDPRLASAILSLPPGVARLYRDDITLIVVELSSSSA